MNTKLDLVFLVDGSHVVTKDTFLSFMFFIKAVTSSLNVSDSQTHVGVAVYGDSSSIFVRFEDYRNQTSLEAAIDDIWYPEHRQSNMGQALSAIASDLYNTSVARENVERVLVVLTASISQDDTAVPSFKLQRYHWVNIFAVGVGAHYSLGQLNEIASNPDGDHVIGLTSGLELSFQTAVFKETLAKGAI